MTARILKMETALHPNGRVKSILYTVNGRVHRDNGPAYQEWNDAGVLIKESWCQNGLWHRDNGPAHQELNDAGELIYESWCQNGLLHRDNRPAYQEWNAAGVLIWESWLQNGHGHRDNGPAYQKWNGAGELIMEVWRQNGRELTAREVEKILQPAEFMHTLRAGLPQPIFEEIESVFRAV